jgi:uncharacterized protein YcfJ
MSRLQAVSASERLFVYPASGQSEQQLADDRYACHEQAVHASGFDPTRAALKPAPGSGSVTVKVPPNASEGATGKGMVAGAMAGAAIGAVAGEHAGEAAIAGAAIGTVIGNSIEHQGAQAAEAQARARGEQQIKVQDERAQKLEQQRIQYRDAFTACLTARGYSVR